MTTLHHSDAQNSFQIRSGILAYSDIAYYYSEVYHICIAHLMENNDEKQFDEKKIDELFFTYFFLQTFY